ARHPVRALIITPTRELAAQIEESVRTYGKYTSLKSALVYGGVGMQPQVDALRRGVDILVATPGRLLDHVQQKTVDLRQVQILVLDEGDRMLDMGFIHDIRRILALLPAQRQNLLFSATFPEEIRKLAQFKAGSLRVLVATDIAARGLDIEALPHVVNYDMPHVAEDYVHRIGRTGRAGVEGEAVSLVSPEERPLLAAIERLMNRKV